MVWIAAVSTSNSIGVDVIEGHNLWVASRGTLLYNGKKGDTFSNNNSCGHQVTFSCLRILVPQVTYLYDPGRSCWSSRCLTLKGDVESAWRYSYCLWYNYLFQSASTQWSYSWSVMYDLQTTTLWQRIWSRGSSINISYQLLGCKLNRYTGLLFYPLLCPMVVLHVFQVSPQKNSTNDLDMY
jgi:hypothetical protein